MDLEHGRPFTAGVRRLAKFSDDLDFARSALIRVRHLEDEALEVVERLFLILYVVDASPDHERLGHEPVAVHPEAMRHKFGSIRDNLRYP
jgi:hypothetical protein